MPRRGADWYRSGKHRGRTDKGGSVTFFYISFFFPSRLRAQVAASTLHSLFDLGANNESKLDFTKRHEKVVALLRTAILLLDEVSMIDCDIFEALAKQLGIADHTRRGTDAGADEYGEVHLMLFGDFKQLPPATSELGRRLGNISDAAISPTSSPPIGSQKFGGLSRQTAFHFHPARPSEVRLPSSATK